MSLTKNSPRRGEEHRLAASQLRAERDRFLEMAYQHIGRPLETVLGLAELLADRNRRLNAAVRNEIIDLLVTHAGEASRLVEDLLIAARFDMDHIDIEVGPVDLRAVVDSAVSGWAARQRSRLEVTGQGIARADQGWVTHIVGSLLRNAAIHGGEQVTVRLHEGHGRVILEVIDDGPGPVGDPDEIFEPYTAGGGGSLGLGLSVSRRLARAMGGDVTFERLGAHTVFALSLPRAGLAPAGRVEHQDLHVDPFEGRPHRSAIEKVIASGPEIVYQPVLELETAALGSAPLGHEALARFAYAPPPVWFETASSHGLRLDLELSAIEASVRGFTADQTPGFLAVNLSDAPLTSFRLWEVLAGIDPGRVVLELSESAVIRNYEETKRQIEVLQDRGIRLAIDDVGATEIDLWHMLRLNPDVVKIDMSLVRGLHQNPRNRALVKGVTAMAGDLGMMVVAEGIESLEEEEALLEIGVRHGQGYLYGTPGALRWATRVLEPDR